MCCNSALCTDRLHDMTPLVILFHVCLWCYLYNCSSGSHVWRAQGPSKQFSITGKRDTHTSSKLSSSSSTIRKYGSSGMGGAAPPSKKPKLSTATGVGGNKEFSLADAGKYGTLSEYAFFDKVRYRVLSSFISCYCLTYLLNFFPLVSNILYLFPFHFVEVWKNLLNR